MWYILPSKVDVLEAGKIGNCKDLNESDNGQIVMARWLDQIISKLQLLWGVPGLQWTVSINSGPRKKQPMTQQQGHGQSRLTDARGD